MVAGGKGEAELTAALCKDIFSGKRFNRCKSSPLTKIMTHNGHQNLCKCLLLLAA